MTTIELSEPRSVASLSIAPTQARHPATRRATADGLAVIAQPARIAAVAAAASIPPIAVLHLSATGPVEPAPWPIRHYVVSLPYGTPLFAMTTGALAIGALALTRGLALITGTRALRVLLTVWATSMLALSSFPPNLAGPPQTVSSKIHLIGGPVVFAVLPVLGRLTARRQRR